MLTMKFSGCLNTCVCIETGLPLLVQEQFVNRLEIVVRKKKMMTVWIDEQWLSEKEMKDDFKWSAWLD